MLGSTTSRQKQRGGCRLVGAALALGMVLLPVAGCTVQPIQPAGTVAGSASSAEIAVPTPIPSRTPAPSPTVLPTRVEYTAHPTHPARETITPAPEVEATATPTKAGAAATATRAPTSGSPPTARADAFRIEGIHLADGKTPLTIRYPKDFEGQERVVITGVDILVSDSDGRSLAIFSDIGSWLGSHKVFVYPDTASGRPVMSVHNGMYAGVPLEAEPLRRLLEGPVFDAYPLDDVLANLERLIGMRFTIEQGAASADFAVSQAIRMDAETTAEFQHRAGELSTLFEPFDQPEHTFLWLMCSARQPDEPKEVFPARFVLALTLATEPL